MLWKPFLYLFYNYWASLRKLWKFLIFFFDHILLHIADYFCLVLPRQSDQDAITFLHSSLCIKDVPTTFSHVSSLPSAMLAVFHLPFTSPNTPLIFHLAISLCFQGPKQLSSSCSSFLFLVSVHSSPFSLVA